MQNEMNMQALVYFPPVRKESCTYIKAVYTLADIVFMNTIFANGYLQPWVREHVRKYSATNNHFQ